MPRFLHRYRPASDVSAGYLADVLHRNQLYAPSPASFNDPFDCRVRLDFQGSRAEWRRFFDGVVRSQHPTLTSGRRRTEVTRIMETGRWRTPAAHNAIVSDLQRDVDDLGVICFCKQAAVPLMWAHYASGHTGFCLRFTTAVSSVAAEALEVTYSKEYPNVRFIDDHDDLIRAFVLTKAYEWRYESEWRFIGYKHGPGRRNFPPAALDAIILGMRIDPAVEAQIRQLALARNLPINVLRAERRANSFRLDIV